MLPKDIKDKRFTSVGKGGYKASEVDEFLKQIHDEFVAVLNNNVALKQRLEQCAMLIDEYNERKKSIASVLIDAQTNAQKQIDDARIYASEIMKKASEEAEELLALKKTEADAYYFDKTHDAAQAVKALQAQIDELRRKYEELLQKYIADATKMAEEIIEKAKNDAAAIVAAAYDDAKTARQKADEIMAEANAELEKIMAQVALFKKQIFAAVDVINPALEAIVLPDKLVSEPTQVEITSAIVEDIPEFSFDEPSKPVTQWVDISSDTTKSVDNSATTPAAQDISSHSDKKASIPDAGSYVSKIFDDSDDEVPLSFSYEGDFDSIVSDALLTESSDEDNE